jgi:hypothetical protein
LEWRTTYHPLEVDQAQPLADVVAYDDQVGTEELPVLGTGGVVKPEAVLAFAGTNLKDKGLVHISQQGYESSALEILAALADPSAWGLAVLDLLSLTLDSSQNTDDRKVDFPHLSSPTNRIVTVCSSIVCFCKGELADEKTMEANINMGSVTYIASLSIIPQRSYRQCQAGAPQIFGLRGVESATARHWLPPAAT